ncbi:MAG: hypothetical protein Q9M92_03880 [Enterobacterales bacterium]|nr:hypothetical protein [Enterobacterales bacterium]
MISCRFCGIALPQNNFPNPSIAASVGKFLSLSPNLFALAANPSPLVGFFSVGTSIAKELNKRYSI